MIYDTRNGNLIIIFYKQWLFNNRHADYELLDQYIHESTAKSFKQIVIKTLVIIYCCLFT